MHSMIENHLQKIAYLLLYIYKKALWSVWKHSQELDPGYLCEVRVQMTITFFFVFSDTVLFFFFLQ